VTPDFTPDSSTFCQNCGAHVSASFRQVYGDENDVCHRCPACDSNRRLAAGSGAGRDVDYPDPADNPNRNRGTLTADGGESRGA
jgi:hypothetical protein